MRTKIRSIFRIEQGFTLIELLAVMAILAVLVGVVAPSVIGSKDASVRAQALQDALQVRSAASKSFSSINEGEVLTPHSVTTLTKISTGTPIVEQTQRKSSKWPEKYITTADNTKFPALYREVFQTSASLNTFTPLGGSLTPEIRDVIMLNKAGGTISAATLLQNHTAIDLAKMVTDKHLEAQPAGVSATTVTVGTNTVPTYLWLFEKKSSDPSRTDDSREVTVYQVVKVSRNEGSVNSPATTVDVTYQRIF